jgi:hypothetical protein
MYHGAARQTIEIAPINTNYSTFITRRYRHNDSFPGVIILKSQSGDLVFESATDIQSYEANIVFISLLRYKVINSKVVLC